MQYERLPVAQEATGIDQVAQGVDIAQVAQLAIAVVGLVARNHERKLADIIIVVTAHNHKNGEVDLGCHVVLLTIVDRLERELKCAPASALIEDGILVELGLALGNEFDRCGHGMSRVGDILEAIHSGVQGHRLGELGVAEDGIHLGENIGVGRFFKGRGAGVGIALGVLAKPRRGRGIASHTVVGDGLLVLAQAVVVAKVLARAQPAAVGAKEAENAVGIGRRHDIAVVGLAAIGRVQGVGKRVGAIHGHECGHAVVLQQVILVQVAAFDGERVVGTLVVHHDFVPLPGIGLGNVLRHVFPCVDAERRGNDVGTSLKVGFGRHAGIERPGRATVGHLLGSGKHGLWQLVACWCLFKHTGRLSSLGIELHHLSPLSCNDFLRNDLSTRCSGGTGHRDKK